VTAAPSNRPIPARRAARITIDYEAIAANWRWFGRRAPGAQAAAVVKANGYGLGAEPAARSLAAAGCRTFFTATAGEALCLRDALGTGPEIYVLNGPSPDDVAHIAGARIVPVLNSLAQIALWAGRGAAAVHVDTGMNRLGLSLEHVGQAAHFLREVDLKLVMSHLACASDPGHEMNARQRACFLEAAAVLPRAPLSLAATAGTLIGSEHHFDLVRVGCGLYGSGGLDVDNPKLETVARITAPILQTRDVASAETFGYGATRRAERPMRTVTVGLGYADGFLRSFAPAGYGMIGEAKLPLLGRVSMDLVILDAAAAPGAQVGDEVEFLGDHARLDDVAAAAGTISYEILTSFAGLVASRS
jgi:alanine racemase